MIARVGKEPELASSASRIQSFFARALRSPALSVVGPLVGPSPRLGYEFTQTGTAPRYAAYAESDLPPARKVSVSPSSAFSDLRFAIYLGDSTGHADLLETNADHLPITGRLAKVTVPFGDRSFTLVASPSGSLGGTLSAWLPWIVAIGGTLLALGATLTTEGLVRRRGRAEHLAIEVGRLYGEQRTIAETLQRALLPDELTTVAGLDIEARYVPGVDGVEIGGDWYDVIPYEDGRILVVVGDVSGRGLGAARVMASLRFAVRAYAEEGEAPGSILSKISRLVNLGRDGHFATVLCALVDVDRRECIVANAGHPAPLLLSAGAGHYLTTVVGPPVGVSSGVDYDSVTCSIPSSATLLIFTDGLIERRGESIDVGLERLVTMAVGAPSGSLDSLLTSVVGDMTPDGSNDDVAMLGLRWQR